MEGSEAVWHKGAVLDLILVSPGSFRLQLSAQTAHEKALVDVVGSLRMWRMWWLLGINDVRQRYRRSRIGQFWITLSMGVFVAAIGVVYSTLLRQPISEYVPFLAVNVVVWGFISGVVNDSTAAFVQAESFLRQGALPKTIFIWRILLRNLIAFAHNAVIIPVVFIVFGVPIFSSWLAVIPGLILLVIGAFLVALVLAILSTRFRDLPQIVANLVQIAFFISPITWRVDSLPESSWWIVQVNPFAVFLRIISEPILGRVPGPMTYLAALGVILVLVLIAVPLFVRFRSRIVYWL